MAAHTDPTPSPEEPGYDCPEEVTVLAVSEKSLPKAVVPLRRGAAEDSTRKADGGIRIEPRSFVEPSDGDPDFGKGELEINRIGEDVVRLESDSLSDSSTQAAAKPVMQQRISRETRQEMEQGEAWGGDGTQSHRWMLWGGAGVVVAIIAGWAIQSFLAYQTSSEGRTQGYADLKVVEDVTPPSGPAAYFEENPGEIANQMRETLSGYARARTVEEVLPLIRNSSAIRPLLAQKWKPWNVPKGWAPTDEAMPSYGSVGSMAYGVIAGRTPDFSPYEVLFVRENGKMLVDWEATTGYSDPPFSTLADASLKSANARVVASPASYYNVAFPESDYLCYRLTAPMEENILWGYVRKGTPAANSMTEVLRQNSVILDGISEAPLRLRLSRGPQGPLPNQWMIVDVLHKGWVSP